MNIVINLAEKESAIKTLFQIRDTEYVPFYIRITNSHIKDLNKIIGRNVFRKDAVYISSATLWEVMQPVGGKGGHHYHELTPEQVYNALSKLRFSKNVVASYDNRYVVITDVNVIDNVYLVVVVSPNITVVKEDLDNVIVVITIYPSDNKK